MEKNASNVAVKAGQACASILVAVGCIGIILGVMNLTGLGLSFASVISSFSDTWLFGSLLVTAFACLILGMGMPTLPAYLIIVLVFMQKYAPKAGMGTLIAMMLPYTFVFAIAWSILLVIWILLGAPLGPGDPLFAITPDAVG
jgi:p-aminobenzoyl-glutamate transporter AbgT